MVQQYFQGFAKRKTKFWSGKETDINSEEGAALCRPLSEKHFASLTFGNIV